MNDRSKLKKLAGVGGALALGVAVVPVAQADGAGAFVGGMMAARVMNNMERRTEAEEYQAYQSRQQPQTVVVQQPPAQAGGSGQASVEQRLATLDRLAANGQISEQEYQSRRKAILDDI